MERGIKKQRQLLKRVSYKIKQKVEQKDSCWFSGTVYTQPPDYGELL